MPTPKEALQRAVGLHTVEGAVTGDEFNTAIGVFTVERFGAVGGGVIDDTDAIRAAFVAAGTGVVTFRTGVRYLCGEITLPDGAKIAGCGATLLANANNVSLLVVPDSVGGLQTGPAVELDDLLLDGNGFTGVKGVSTTGALSCANLSMFRVTAQNCDFGFNMIGTQFATGIRCKAYNCNVGLYIKSATGGGNSWSFYDFIGVGCKVGVALNNASIYPMQAIYFRNASLLANNVCAMALFGGVSAVLDGSANEDNGNGVGSGFDSYTFDSVTAKRSSIYLNASTLGYINSNCGEATINPCVLLENGAKLNLLNVEGYGLAAGRFVKASATSKVTINGSLAVTGSIENVTDLGAAPSTPVLIAAPACARIDYSIPNEADPPQVPSVSEGNGVTSAALVNDDVLGYAFETVYLASAGTQDTNRTRFGFTLAASGLAMVAFNIKSSVDGAFSMGLYPNIGIKTLTLRAGVYYRIIWFCDTAVAGAPASFTIYPVDSAGATVHFANFHVFSSTDTVNGRATMGSIARGSYNPKVAALRPQIFGTAAPITGTWTLGARVYNSAPVAGGNEGWVVTTPGAAGVFVFKAFGTIAS